MLDNFSERQVVEQMGSEPRRYLNDGVYYEPPTDQPTEIKSRYDWHGCLLSWCAICMLSLVILGLLSPLLWAFIFRPYDANIYVTDGNVNRFSLDPNSYNLHYSVDLNFTIRNPNRRVGIYYDEFSVDGYYGGLRFGSGKVSSFYQGQKNTTVIGTRIEGENYVVLGYGATRDLKEDEKYGIYRIGAKLRLSVRFKFWLMKSWKLKPMIQDVTLLIPRYSSNSTRGFRFQPVPFVFLYDDSFFS